MYMGSRKMVLILLRRDGDSDTENKLVDASGGGGGMN